MVYYEPFTLFMIILYILKIYNYYIREMGILMKIFLLAFISSYKDLNNNGSLMMKKFDSDFRPAKGDIIEDPGFLIGFHNGYEVVKVTINYELNECMVSLQPLVINKEEVSVEIYIENLKMHGWSVVSKDDLLDGMK